MNTRKLLQLIRDNAKAGNQAAPLRMEATDAEAHIYVYDVIDAWWGASASALVTALQSADGRPVHMHWNTPGGDVFEARAMASAIVAYPNTVISHVDGLVASAGTYAALSANEVRMTNGGMFMVHNGWTMAWGNKAELRDLANLLEKVDGTIAADYAQKTGKDQKTIVDWMDAETWFTSDEAKAVGFVDIIDPSSKAAGGAEAKALVRAWNLSAYANAPKELQASAQERAEIQDALARQQQRNANRLRLLTT